jgi:uncharacterized iron-regulated membrane protein
MKNFSLRELLHTVHLWIGVILCVPLFLLGVTGSILVFEHDIDDWLDPLPPASAVTGPVQPVSEIVAAARAAVPKGYAPLFFFAAPPDGLAEVRMRAGGGGPGAPAARVFVDPLSLVVVAVRETGAGWLRTIAQLHGNLLTRERWGRASIGWLGVAMLTLGVSGLVMWWPRGGRWRAVFRFQRGLRGPLLLREFHRTAGFWGLVVFVIVSFSGVYLAFPQSIGDTIRLVTPAREMRGFNGPAVKPVADVQPLDIQGAIALVSDAAPDMELRTVAFPARPDQTIRISFAEASSARGPVPMLTAFVDPWAKKIVELRDPRTYSAAESFLAWQRAMHAGEGLGNVWRGLVFLSGFLPVLFTITGFSMWLMRRRSKRRATAVRTTPVEVAGD